MSCRVSGRGRLFLRAIAVVIFAAATACSRSAPAAERATIDAPALFAQACAKCHAADGTGGLPMVANGPGPADLTAAGPVHPGTVPVSGVVVSVVPLRLGESA